MSPNPFVLALAVVPMLLAGCGTDASGPAPNEAGSPTSTTERSSSTEPDPDTTAVEAAEETTTTAAAPTTTRPFVDTIPHSELPGQRMDLYVTEGSVMGVVGVEFDDILNVRAGPGASYPVVTTLDPLTGRATNLGTNRAVSDGGWWALVETEGGTGWVNFGYLGYLGMTRDITAEIGSVGAASTLDDLGVAIGYGRLHGGEEGVPRVVVVARSTIGGDHEIVVDVLGFMDDALRGERLRIRADEEHGSFRMRSVESTRICDRGVSDEGLCQ